MNLHQEVVDPGMDVDLPSNQEPVTHPNSVGSGLRRLGSLIGAVTTTKAGAVGLVIIGLYATVALIGPWLAPYSATTLDVTNMHGAPSLAHPFGTDAFGRDVFSRVLNGARGTILVAVGATTVGVTCGVFVGLVTGYYRGWVDEVIMRIVDGLMSFPSLLLALLIVTTLGSSGWNVLLAIGLVFTPRVARIVRAAALSVRGQEFVEAARLRGESGLYIMLREILPNVSAPTTVEAAIRLSYAILLTTSLSFLGLGAQPPSPDWGLMVAESRENISIAPWALVFPSLAISFLVVGANLLADGIRDALNYGSERT